MAMPRLEPILRDDDLSRTHNPQVGAHFVSDWVDPETQLRYLSLVGPRAQIWLTFDRWQLVGIDWAGDETQNRPESLWARRKPPRWRRILCALLLEPPRV